MPDPATPEFEIVDPFGAPELIAPVPADFDALTLPAGQKTWSIGTLTYDKRGLAWLFGWLQLGDLCFEIKTRTIRDTVRLVTRIFGITNLQMSLLLVSVPKTISLLLMPPLSYISDRHRGRWGRRRPFLAIPAPLCTVALILMAFSPAAGGWLHRALGHHSPGLNNVILILFAINFTFFEIFAYACGAVHVAFTNDVVPRSVLSRYYAVARILAWTATIIFFGEMFGAAIQHYVAVFIGVGLVYGGGFTLAVIMVKEGEYPPPPQGPRRSLFAAVREYCRDCFTKPYYLWVLLASVCSTFSFSVVYEFSLYFSQNVGLSADVYGKLLVVTSVLSVIVAWPMGWTADRFHPLRMSIVMLALYAAAALWGGVAIHDGKTFAILYVLTGVLSAAHGVATAALGQLLLPHLKFAQYNSAIEVVASIMALSCMPLVARLIDVTGNTYRYTFLISAIMAFLSLAATIVVYRMFLDLGGDKAYVPPE